MTVLPVYSFCLYVVENRRDEKMPEGPSFADAAGMSREDISSKGESTKNTFAKYPEDFLEFG